jgi:hypothetical protein
MKKNNDKHRTVLSISSAITVLGMLLAPQAYSMPLLNNPTFTQLPIPLQNPGVLLGVPRIITTDNSPNGFSGTWEPTNANIPWNGVNSGFSGTGVLPTGANVGLGKYDFMKLNQNGGLLPVGTFFGFGDLDNGSGAESITLQAFDAANMIISNPWLDSPISVFGADAGQNNMPEYMWDPILSLYRFSGLNVPGNPDSLNFQLVNTEEMGFLEVDKTGGFGFALSAPTVRVPEPEVIWLLGLGFIGLLGLARPGKV